MSSARIPIKLDQTRTIQYPAITKLRLQTDVRGRLIGYSPRRVIEPRLNLGQAIVELPPCQLRESHVPYARAFSQATSKKRSRAPHWDTCTVPCNLLDRRRSDDREGHRGVQITTKRQSAAGDGRITNEVGSPDQNSGVRAELPERLEPWDGIGSWRPDGRRPEGRGGDRVRKEDELTWRVEDSEQSVGARLHCNCCNAFTDGGTRELDARGCGACAGTGQGKSEFVGLVRISKEEQHVALADRTSEEDGGGGV